MAFTISLHLAFAMRCRPLPIVMNGDLMFGCKIGRIIFDISFALTPLMSKTLNMGKAKAKQKPYFFPFPSMIVIRCLFGRRTLMG
ncbi:hypothetical protein CEXT_800291 [Caerostris extrusa]|uniref:Secreted protein n=1 Tax=Caerostris extrusa TaxID=172846 RepID=A0AAV4N1S4_CAEEX|nr:hypothetical protein CEXT_800291 [Caerostris extrusa]